MPKIVDHHRYRQELLEGCLALFAEQGFSAVTMRQIAVQLGVSTGTLYHYFPSKEGVFSQIVEEYCEKGVAEFFAHASAEAAISDKLRHVMAFFLQNYDTYQQQMLIWVDFYQHSQRQKDVDISVFATFWQRTQAQLTAYLQISGEQAESLLIFMDGLLMQFLYGRSAPQVAQQAEAFITLFEQGYSSR